MNISKHKTCFGSIKYSQVLESLSLRGGVRRKAYAPYRNYVIPLRDCISQSLSTLQHPLSFPIMTLFHITAKTQRPWNYHQLLLSPPNFRYPLASVQSFPSRRTLTRKIISGQFFWMLESIPCYAVRKHCPLKCLTLIFSLHPSHSYPSSDFCHFMLRVLTPLILKTDWVNQLKGRMVLASCFSFYGSSSMNMCATHAFSVHC